MTKLDAPVRVSETEITTIADLAAQGRITWARVDNWHSRRSATGMRVAYFANLDNGAGWEISRLAYLSRTGQVVSITK